MGRRNRLDLDVIADCQRAIQSDPRIQALQQKQARIIRFAMRPVLTFNPQGDLVAVGQEVDAYWRQRLDLLQATIESIIEEIKEQHDQ